MRKSVQIALSLFFMLLPLRLGATEPKPYQEGDVPWVKFDEYSDISVRKERPRLDQFIATLRAHGDSTAYIIAYGGRHSCPGEAKARGSYVRAYLISRGGFEAKRIKIIDGGYCEEWMISLYIAQPDAPPLTYLSPGLQPKQVRLVKNCQRIRDRRLHHHIQTRR